MKKNELILNPSDPRKYKGGKLIKKKPKSLVIVLEEGKNGENTQFLDVLSGEAFSKDEFVVKIKEGLFPKYEIRLVNGKEVPFSKKDRKDNLG